MPAELLVLALPGGGLLLWAALRARSRRALTAWGLGIAVVMLFGGQVAAVTTGLARGEVPLSEGHLWRALVLGSIVGYDLSLLAVGVGGALLLRDLYGRPQP